MFCKLESGADFWQKALYINNIANFTNLIKIDSDFVFYFESLTKILYLNNLTLL